MHKHRKYKKDFRILIFDSFVDGIRKLITLPFQTSTNKYQGEVKELKREYVQAKWQEIEELISLGSPARFKQAVIEADKLFDLALKNLGVYGENMGIRLKNAKDKFAENTYQGIWQAHKVRNEIVHESDRELLDQEAKDVVEKIKRALEELKTI